MFIDKYYLLLFWYIRLFATKYVFIFFCTCSLVCFKFCFILCVIWCECTALLSFKAWLGMDSSICCIHVLEKKDILVHYKYQNKYIPLISKLNDVTCSNLCSGVKLEYFTLSHSQEKKSFWIHSSVCISLIWIPSFTYITLTIKISFV